MRRASRHLHHRNGQLPHGAMPSAPLGEARGPLSRAWLWGRLVRDGASMFALALVALGFAWGSGSVWAVRVSAAVVAVVAGAWLVAVGGWWEARRRERRWSEE
jgi:hypothetical protein